jgi:hypothetical protein
VGPLQALIAAGMIAADPASADGAAEPKDIGIALGMKAGFIPPVFATPEFLVHIPHLALGVFGILTDGGPGGGGLRSTLGFELGFERAPTTVSTPYLWAAYFHYDAAPDANGFYEKSDVLMLTAGYEWKWKHFEVQLGAGALFILKDETPPCREFICINITIPVLPAVDFGARYRF